MAAGVARGAWCLLVGLEAATAFGFAPSPATRRAGLASRAGVTDIGPLRRTGVAALPWQGRRAACGRRWPAGIGDRAPTSVVGGAVPAGGGDGSGGARDFGSFTLLEMAAGSGEVTLQQAYDAASALAGQQAELTTLDLMAALGACFASADLSVAGVGVDDLWALVADFERRGAAPNMMACTHLLGLCVKLAADDRADHSDGLRVLDWAKGRGIHPDAVMVSQVMNICAKAAVHGRCTLGVLQEVLAYAAALDPPVAGNVITYTTMMDAVSKAALARNASLADARAVWQRMLGTRRSAFTHASTHVRAHTRTCVRVRTSTRAHAHNLSLSLFLSLSGSRELAPHDLPRAANRRRGSPELPDVRSHVHGLRQRGADRAAGYDRPRVHPACGLCVCVRARACVLTQHANAQEQWI